MLRRKGIGKGVELHFVFKEQTRRYRTCIFKIGLFKKQLNAQQINW